MKRLIMGLAVMAFVWAVQAQNHDGVRHNGETPIAG